MIVLGVDFGNTIEYKNAEGEKIAFHGMYEILTALVREVDQTHIISKVNERQEREVSEWIAENNFFAKVGIPPENLHFCPERRDKAAICKRLGVTHMIDDRPEVMAHLEPEVFKYMFRPKHNEVIDYYNQITNAKIVASWAQVGNIFRTNFGLNIPEI